MSPLSTLGGYLTPRLTKQMSLWASLPINEEDPEASKEVSDGARRLAIVICHLMLIIYVVIKAMSGQAFEVFSLSMTV